MPFNKVDVARLAVAVALALVLPLVAGVLVDMWQDSSPIWTVVGVIAGSICSVLLVSRRIWMNLNTYLAGGPDDEKRTDTTATLPNEEEPAQWQDC